jgi:hypothetical protein
MIFMDTPDHRTGIDWSTLNSSAGSHRSTHPIFVQSGRSLCGLRVSGQNLHRHLCCCLLAYWQGRDLTASYAVKFNLRT